MKVDLPPERVFASSDFHGFHKNICKGSTTWTSGSMRDFPDEVSMTHQLVKNINSVVGVDDILIHLGDWSFGGKDKVKILREMINCKNIIALKGNHDYNIIKDKELQKLFTKWYGDIDVDPIVHFTVGKHRYVCSHYNMNIWEDSHHAVRHLFGHSHHSLTDNPNALSLDVGVDGYDLFPLSFVQIEEKMSKKVYKPVDHHRETTN